MTGWLAYFLYIPIRFDCYVQINGVWLILVTRWRFFGKGFETEMRRSNLLGGLQCKEENFVTCRIDNECPWTYLYLRAVWRLRTRVIWFQAIFGRCCVPSPRHWCVFNWLKVLFVHGIITAMSVEGSFSLLDLRPYSWSAVDGWHKASRAGNADGCLCRSIIKALVFWWFRGGAVSWSTRILIFILDSLLHEWSARWMRRRFTVTRSQIRRIWNRRHQVMAFIGNVVRAGAFLEHPVCVIGIVFVTWFGVSTSNAKTSAFLDFTVIVGTWEARVTWFTRIQIFLTIPRRSLLSTAVLAEFIRLADNKVINWMQLCLLDLKTADAVLGMRWTSWSFTRFIFNPFTLMVTSGAVCLTISFRMPLVLIQSLLNGLWCIFGFVWWWWLRCLLKNLQFGQWDDITI